MDSPAVITITIILSVAATVFLSMLFFGSKLKEKFGENKIVKFADDAVNFRTLLIDKIMKVLYIFANCVCIIGGVILFFCGFYPLFKYGSFATMGYALLSIIFGPIALRITFELIMLAITLVQNVVEINRKMDGLKKE